jgi:methionyl-tRNA formyltransferase
VRTVFFGTPEIAVPSLEAVAAKHEVLAAVCQPDRAKGRSGKPAPPPVKLAAERLGIPVAQPAKLNDGIFEAWLKEQQPDVCTVAAYGRLLKQPLLDVPPLGWLNMHPSLLPRWRGPSPIASAILSGDTETGVSIMRLILEMDAGDVLLQVRTPIDPEEDAEVLGMRLAEMGAPLLVEAMDRVSKGTATFTPQDPAFVTYCKMLSKEDGRIRWSDSAENIHRLVRGTFPWPSAQCLFKGQVCRIHKSSFVAEGPEVAPGTISAVEQDCIWVATGCGQLAVQNFQVPGKRAMSMGEFLRGHAIRPGECLGEVV